MEMTQVARELIDSIGRTAEDAGALVDAALREEGVPQEYWGPVVPLDVLEDSTPVVNELREIAMLIDQIKARVGLLLDGQGA